jgi:hypothetical protein
MRQSCDLGHSLLSIVHETPFQPRNPRYRSSDRPPSRHGSHTGRPCPSIIPGSWQRTCLVSITRACKRRKSARKKCCARDLWLRGCRTRTCTFQPPKPMKSGPVQTSRISMRAQCLQAASPLTPWRRRSGLFGTPKRSRRYAAPEEILCFV